MSAAPAPGSAGAGWRLDNSYARLPDVFHARVNPTPVARPHLVVFNRALATSLGLDPDAVGTPAAGPLWTGNERPEGAEPIAQAYAGHQFGHFTRLGDGRAILLGEQQTPDGRRCDIQWKGAGPTPWSRRGDGRAALGPMLREYLISEAMAALGIPTTRSLAVAATGEPVFREEPLPGAVLTRVAASHIRVGTFEYLAARGDPDALRLLADHALRRHYPGPAETANPALALLEQGVERQAWLLAQWMRVGFVHGVMNTDNMAISGETIDYGPCAFLDAYDPGAVFSSIDHQGRYAFGNQPSIAAWNLARWAETLLPLLHPDPESALELARPVAESFATRFQRHWLDAGCAKLGLFDAQEEDGSLLDELLDWMQANRADYTRTFRSLDPAGEPLAPDLAGWQRRWVGRLARQPQSAAAVAARRRSHNPAVIPRNHEVEAALAEATTRGDLARFHRLLAAVSRPYEDAGQPESLLHPPPPGTPPCRTFCGT